MNPPSVSVILIGLVIAGTAFISIGRRDDLRQNDTVVDIALAFVGLLLVISAVVFPSWPQYAIATVI